MNEETQEYEYDEDRGEYRLRDDYLRLIKDNQHLFERLQEEIADKDRMVADRAELRSECGRLIAKLAQARGRISELEAWIAAVLPVLESALSWRDAMAAWDGGPHAAEQDRLIELMHVIDAYRPQSPSNKDKNPRVT